MRSIIPSSFSKKFFIALFLIATAKQSFSQTLDSSFGTNGITNLPPNGNDLRPKSAVFQNDKILIGFYSVDADNYQPEVDVYRLTKNGKIDSSFGNYNGFINFNFTTGGYITLQKDNRILVAVSGTYNPQGYPIHVYRLLPNGKHDKSFGDNGMFIYKNNNFRNSITQISVRNDDKIIVAGNFNKRDSAHVSFFQLTKDGQLDSAFGKKGFIYQTLSYEQSCVALKILPNNKVLCGFVYDSGKLRKTCLIKYTQRGKIDSSFGTNGIIVNNNNIKRSTQYYMGLAITHDNKILEFAADSNKQAILYRFTANGKPDKFFGHKGNIIIPEREDEEFSIAIDSANRILVNDVKKNLPTIIRYTEDGKIDSAFGVNGSLTTNNLGYQILIQSPDKFIATGYDVIARYKLNNVAATSSSVPQPATQNSLVSVYPNPVTGIMHINALNTREETQVSVYDAAGKLAMFKVIKNTNELEVHQLPAGVYYLNISSPVQHAGIKFIKN